MGDLEKYKIGGFTQPKTENINISRCSSYFLPAKLLNCRCATAHLGNASIECSRATAKVAASAVTVPVAAVRLAVTASQLHLQSLMLGRHVFPTARVSEVPTARISDRRPGVPAAARPTGVNPSARGALGLRLQQPPLLPSRSWPCWQREDALKKLEHQDWNY